MQERFKKYSLGLCLFVFLFVILGGGLHLSPGGAFVAAMSGTPLVIYAFNRSSAATHRPACDVSVARGKEHSLGGDELEDHADFEMGQ